MSQKIIPFLVVTIVKNGHIDLKISKTIQHSEIFLPDTNGSLSRSKREVPRGVRNSKVRRQDKFRRDWSRH